MVCFHRFIYFILCFCHSYMKASPCNRQRPGRLVSLVSDGQRMLEGAQNGGWCPHVRHCACKIGLKVVLQMLIGAIVDPELAVPCRISCNLCMLCCCLLLSCQCSEQRPPLPSLTYREIKEHLWIGFQSLFFFEG